MVVVKNAKKQDILNREDIIRLIDLFYEKVHKDDKLAPVFIMPMEHWKQHLHRTANFWDNMLFGTGSYKGGLMWVHVQKHKENPFTAELFEHWLAHWFFNVDENFEGPNATFVKEKALQVGQIMNHKLNG